MLCRNVRSIGYCKFPTKSRNNATIEISFQVALTDAVADFRRKLPKKYTDVRQKRHSFGLKKHDENRNFRLIKQISLSMRLQFLYCIAAGATLNNQRLT